MARPMVFCDGKDVYEEEKGEKELNFEKWKEKYFTFGYGAFISKRNNARKRGISFSLTFKEFQAWWRNTEDICWYCGNTAEEYQKIKKFLFTQEGKRNFSMFKKIFRNCREIKRLTFDRQDNQAGYEFDNIVKSCWLCNGMKSAMFTAEETKAFMPGVIKDIKKNIYNHSII